MVKASLRNLTQLKDFLLVISDEIYCYKSQWLSGTTIGEHTRHILEFYTCLLQGAALKNPVWNGSSKSLGQVESHFEKPVVNYDKRKRDHEIEGRRQKAIDTIDFICNKLEHKGFWAEKLTVEGDYEHGSEEVISIESSFDRELLYNYEHTIHHQALIRVGLMEQNKQHLLDENFGVAPSTIKAKK